MADVVELRVHGVGGSTPEALLGVASATDATLVAGDGAAAFWARREDPSVEGYVWGGLTSGGLTQTLWIALLPFTLLNVAGWMYPPSTRSRWSFARACSRVLLALIGLSITIGYLLWMFAIIALVALNKTKFQGVLRHLSLGGRVVASGVAVTMLGVIVYFVTRSRQTRFEAFGEATSAAAPASQLIGSVFGEQSLADRTLWSEERLAKFLLRIHIATATVALLGFGSWLFVRVRDTHALPDFHRIFDVTIGAQIVMALILLLVYLVFEPPTGFRFAGPATFTIIAIALTNEAFSGLWQFTAHALHGAEELNNPIGHLYPDFGAGMLVFGAAILVWIGGHLGRYRRQKSALLNEGIPLDTSRAGEQQNGLTPGVILRTALLRAFTTAPRNADLVLTASAAAFVLIPVAVAIGWVDLPTWVGPVGQFVLLSVAAAAVPFFIYRAWQPAPGRKIAIIWDVFTFFPRRYHPLAVRPYAERAVPELQGRIAYHRQHHRKVILCGHSQGSVIAFAALTQLAATDDSITKGVALVTFGSPLAQLHARFFSEAFGADGLFEDVRSSLVTIPSLPDGSWRNFFHRTDYVGQELFRCTGHPGRDRELPDPPQETMFAPDDPSGPLVPKDDQAPPAWVKNTVHSFYFVERELRAWIAMLRGALS